MWALGKAGLCCFGVASLIMLTRAQGDSLRMRFTATVAGEVVLAHDERCSVSVNSRQINGKAIDSSEIALKSRGYVVQYPIALAAARNGAVVSVRC